jgi:hypothetical protein
MKPETYKTLVAMDRQDPMTDVQRKALAGKSDDDEILTIKQVSEMTGLSPITLRGRKKDLPPLKFSRWLRYKKSDVMKFINMGL